MEIYLIVSDLFFNYFLDILIFFKEIVKIRIIKNKIGQIK
jgi:hypothetical protein